MLGSQCAGGPPAVVASGQYAGCRSATWDAAVSSCSRQRIAVKTWPRISGIPAPVMVLPPTPCRAPRHGVAEAAKQMYDRGVKRLPVVDSGGLLAGIVTRIDVRSVFRRPDDQLRDEVMERLITGRFALNPEAFRRHRDLKHRYHYWPVESGALAPQLVDAVRHAEGVIDVRGRVSIPLRPRRGPQGTSVPAGAGAATRSCVPLRQGTSGACSDWIGPITIAPQAADLGGDAENLYPRATAPVTLVVTCSDDATPRLHAHCRPHPICDAGGQLRLVTATGRDRAPRRGPSSVGIMVLAEDLLLLVTDDASGRLSAPAAQVDAGLGGANLVELSLMNRVDLSGDGNQGKPALRQPWAGIPSPRAGCPAASCHPHNRATRGMCGQFSRDETI